MRTGPPPVRILLGTEQRNLGQELEINQGDLAGELVTQPSWYAYYATLMAEAGIVYDQVRSEFESLQADVSNTVRTDAIRSGERITEKKIETLVAAKPVIQAKKRLLQEKKREYELLKVVVRSFEQRLQALISLCSMERIRFKGEENATNPSSPLPASSINGRPTAREEMLEELQKLQNSKKKG